MLSANILDSFNFRKSMRLETINNETQSIARKTHLFWEHPLLDQKIDKLLEALSNSGEAKYKLNMPADFKDAKGYFEQNPSNRSYVRNGEIDGIDSAPLSIFENQGIPVNVQNLSKSF